MRHSLVAERYSGALFNLAKERGEIEKIEKELVNVLQIVHQYPEISNLLLNSTIAQSEKEDFIDKVFPGSISKLILEFLKVLVKKHRFDDLSAIQKSYHQAYETHENIEEITVTTAVPITKTIEEKLIQIFSQTLNAKIILTKEIDPHILGGYILHRNRNAREIDASYRTRLLELKQILLR